MSLPIKEGDKKILGFRRNVFFLGLVSLFNDFSNGMIQSVMPVFLSVTLGVPPVFIGVLEGAADAVASFLKIVSGHISDRVHKRKSLTILGYALSVAVRPLYVVASSFSRILAIRVTDRIGKKDFARRQGTLCSRNQLKTTSLASLLVFSDRWTRLEALRDRWARFLSFLCSEKVIIVRFSL